MSPGAIWTGNLPLRHADDEYNGIEKSVTCMTKRLQKNPHKRIMHILKAETQFTRIVKAAAVHNKTPIAETSDMETFMDTSVHCRRGIIHPAEASLVKNKPSVTGRSLHQFARSQT
ncbi:hypothetical protein Bbelb_436980 [Branchiostoma belcheri]|nr:hypothetical protein Bbelb_436980 [Branchiostoma belcheri]